MKIILVIALAIISTKITNKKLKYLTIAIIVVLSLSVLFSLYIEYNVINNRSFEEIIYDDKMYGSWRSLEYFKKTIAEYIRSLFNSVS